MRADYVTNGIGILFLGGWLGLVRGICAPTACEVRTRTDAGWVCGRVRAAEDGSPYASFRGVPYAKPPLRERRFKELEPPEPWDDLYDATEDRAACPQKDSIYSRLPLQVRGQSEDCLYLNLHTPALNPVANGTDGRPVPIIVMVHGGGFQAGSGLTDMHGPEYMLRNKVVVITFNYRINIFGYLSLNTAKIPGNQALRDIIFLLRWVRRNARAFGGDPDNVTLLGHSTGGTAAHLVSLSLPARGLIHKVILMSGTAIPHFFNPSQAHAKIVADKLLAALGIQSTDPDVIHDRLTKIPLFRLMSALNVIQSQGLTMVLQLNLVPVVESEFPNVTRIIDEDPMTLIVKGRGKEYPLIAGFTAAEFNYFKLQLLGSDIVKQISTDAATVLAERQRNHYQSKEQQRLANEIKDRYFKKTVRFEEVLNYYSDMFYVHPTMLVGEWRSFWGAPVYLYQFSYESERNVIKEANWCDYSGVAHVEDLTYIFRTNSILQSYVAHPPKNNDDLMKEWFPMLFANFMHCGNPTCTEDEVQWPPLASGRLAYQNIAVPKVYQMANLTADQRDMMAFFYQIDDQLRTTGEQMRLHGGSRY